MMTLYSLVSGYDRVDTYPGSNDIYYGYDYEDGCTLWVLEDGTQDCITETPKGDSKP